MAVGGGEEVFHRAVFASHLIDGRHSSHLIGFSQSGACVFGEVGHLVDARGVFAVEPVGHLFAREGGLSESCRHGLEFGRVEAEQALFVVG